MKMALYTTTKCPIYDNHDALLLNTESRSSFIDNWISYFHFFLRFPSTFLFVNQARCFRPTQKTVLLKLYQFAQIIFNIRFFHPCNKKKANINEAVNKINLSALNLLLML